MNQKQQQHPPSYQMGELDIISGSPDDDVDDNGGRGRGAEEENDENNDKGISTSTDNNEKTTAGVADNEGESGDDDNSVAASSTSSDSSSSRHGRFYNWHLYVPETGSSIVRYLRWLMVGGGAFATPQSDEDLEHSLMSLSRVLTLLRHYLATHGMPQKGGIEDQEYVLREITRDLYAGGTPLWALEPVMQKAAEGLTVRIYLLKITCII